MIYATVTADGVPTITVSIVYQYWPATIDIGFNGDLIMKKEQIVSRNPKVMNGALVFAGTRVPVEVLIQHLTAGDSLKTFLNDFPTVSHEQAVAYLKMTLEVADARVA